MTRSDRPHHSPSASAAPSPQIPPARAALTLVARTPRPAPTPAPRSLLALWHLLSLDAPCVAATWTLAIAFAVGIHLRWTAPAAMFVAVWMLYAADRILDARILDTLPTAAPPSDLEERHRFHHRHRRAFLAAIAAAAVVLAALLHTLDPAALRLYTLLATLLAAWLLLIHARPLPAANAHRLPKELAVGIFFPAAVFIPTVARAPQLRLTLLPAAALLACVCTLNCLFLYSWEHPRARPHAHWTTRWATARLVPLTLATLGLSAALLAAALFRASQLAHADALIAASTLSSAALLLLLHRLRARLQPIHLRALADLVLLTPILVAPLTSLLR